MKYRKRPVIIDAYQTDHEMDIETLEGTMHASVGDYIVTGVRGERYPCKPGIFRDTYDEVKDPERVKILYADFMIEEIPNLHDDGHDLYGQIDCKKSQILLDAELEEDQKKATLLHECIHALDEMMAIPLSEDQTERIATGIYQLLKDNPGLFV